MKNADLSTLEYTSSSGRCSHYENHKGAETEHSVLLMLLDGTAADRLQFGNVFFLFHSIFLRCARLCCWSLPLLLLLNTCIERSYVTSMYTSLCCAVGLEWP